MNGMNEVRRKAWMRRASLGIALEAIAPAEEILRRCEELTGIEVSRLDAGDILLAGAQAVLDLSNQAIYQDGSLSLPTLQYDAAHEFAHVWLHGGSCHCATTDLNGSDSTTALLDSVEGYSLKQRRESEANVFAAELLLPGPLARRLFLEEGRSSAEISATLGLPVAVVDAQLAEAILLPPLSVTPQPQFSAAVQAVRLDPFQEKAAKISEGPLLLGAGPGTGKTKTLVGRCQHLVTGMGVAPEKILALTFSRKAAQEMRERLAQGGIGDDTVGPWVGTFHGFGLDVLRRFGERMALPTEIRLLDTLDQITLLENHLPQLSLETLDNLYNPAVHLRGILRQISRAKDELCPPERYTQLCASMQARAEQATAELSEQAQRTRKAAPLKKEMEAVTRLHSDAAKAGEVAHVYAVYETLMREHGYLDYGDLLYRTVHLLDMHPDILAQLHAEFPHVLADEYQDVNRACAALIRRLAGEEAKGLWAVGDYRQSIYRFRGASPANITAFQQDYPTGVRLKLGINYRSQEAIVDCFADVAARMMSDEAQEAFDGWTAHRGRDKKPGLPAVTLAVASDEDGQAAGIARTIEELHRQGREYRDQAILCRTHGQAEDLVRRLTVRQIPVLYLGELRERPEIKDLLCLLSLFTDKTGVGLLRAATLPEYAVPREDVLAFLKRMGTAELSPRQALQQQELLEGLTAQGQAGLRRLGGHLAAWETQADDPGVLLRHYLFQQSAFLRPSAAESEILTFQRRLAIHQLLQLAANFDRRLIAPAGCPDAASRVRQFLSHLQRLATAGESLRGLVPDAAEEIDAVRVMTAHAAKGLEYPVVFLPNLGANQFPARGRHDGIPEPPELTEGAPMETDEEQCLFFVALSRARDYLIVSRAENTDAGKAISPSPLLGMLASWQEAQKFAETAWPSERTETALVLTETEGVTGDLPVFSSSALEQYLRCPRQYHYERELKIKGSSVAGSYQQFHHCLHQTLHWIDDERTEEREPDTARITAKLEEIWAASGPVGHVHEAKYRISATEMLQTAYAMDEGSQPRIAQTTLTATLANCRVRVRPDIVRAVPHDGTVIVARRMTGKPGTSDHTDKRLALLRRAVEETFPDRPHRLELRYLSEGNIREIDKPATAYTAKLEGERLLKYEHAARGIQLRLFAAEPASGDECRQCAYSLVCPA